MNRHHLVQPDKDTPYHFQGIPPSMYRSAGELFCASGFHWDGLLSLPGLATFNKPWKMETRYGSGQGREAYIPSNGRGSYG